MSEENASRNDREPALTPRQLATWVVIGAAFFSAIFLSSLRCELGPTSSRAYASRTLPPEPAAELLGWEPQDDEYYPCSDCHEDEETNRTVRPLEDEHDELELAHGDLWCLHCHDTDDRDALHLADDTRARFEDSWQLCTQCHAEKRADWRAGVHGRRTGNWWGAKQYRTCVTCHDPHGPRYRALEPKPPPQRLERIVRDGRMGKEGLDGEGEP
jgi:hypothetical protein